MSLALLDLFSGIGGFSLGLERSGLCKTVAFCEIDPFCRRVLAKHWPEVPCHNDITTRNFHEGEADVICGGFPCQDVSLAGKRAGLAGARSGLYRELVRAVRLVRPRIAIVENVAALLSDGMGTVLGDLSEIGDCVEWDCVPASAIGAPHQRDRVWIVAHADSEGRPQSTLSRNEQRVWARDEAETLSAPDDAADFTRQQMGSPGQPWKHERMGPAYPDSASHGCGQRRSRRPPDSFARVRDEARRNSTDPYGARLAFRSGLSRDAWEKLTPAERDSLSNGGQSVWPDEPALSGMDDGIHDWMERVKCTGNTVVPAIPELIGRSIKQALAEEMSAP